VGEQTYFLKKSCNNVAVKGILYILLIWNIIVFLMAMLSSQCPHMLK